MRDQLIHAYDRVDLEEVWEAHAPPGFSAELECIGEASLLGGMALAGLVRLSQHPIQVKLEHSFTEPLQLSGKIKGELNMPRAVQIEPTRSLAVKMVEQAPIKLSVTNRTPVEVQVRNAQPIQVKVDESKPIQVDMDPQAPVKVKVGF